MDIKSEQQVDGLIELNKLKKVQKIEKNLQRLSYVPIYASVGIILYFFWLIWFKVTITSPTFLFFVGVIIVSLARANVKRTDLLKDLFELKYDK